MMLEAGYADAYRVRHPSGEGDTFPTSDPHVRLDYAFIPDAFKDRVAACDVMRDLPAARHASDHFPLLTDLRIS